MNSNLALQFGFTALSGLSLKALMTKTQTQILICKGSFVMLDISAVYRQD